MKNRYAGLIAPGAVALAALMSLPGLAGCSKPAAQETRDSKGNLNFPNTGRLPTAEELAKINKGRQGQPPGPPAARP